MACRRPAGFPQPRRLDHLRLLLVHAGVLPTRDEHLERIPLWIDQTLSGRPALQQVLIRPFASWAVLRASRRAAARGRYPEARATRDRTKILTALRLLDWTDQRALTLQTMNQAHLDDWLTQQPAQNASAAIKAFITWTNHRHVTCDLQVVQRRHGEPTTFLDPVGHLAQLRRCLRDDSLPLEIRISGALLLLYGITVTRIARLRATDIARSRTSTFLTIDRRPVLLPASLARLLEQLLATPAAGSALTDDRQLLFPSRIPSRPRTPGSLVTQLNRHGLHARPARNTALITLAADLPAAVLADLIGMHPATAVRWARLSSSDWSAYLAAEPGHSTRRR